MTNIISEQTKIYWYAEQLALVYAPMTEFEAVVVENTLKHEFATLNEKKGLCKMRDTLAALRSRKSWRDSGATLEQIYKEYLMNNEIRNMLTMQIL